MPKRKFKWLSEKTARNLIKEVDRAIENFKEVSSYIKEQYKPLINKSTHYLDTLMGNDQETMNVMGRFIKDDLKRYIKTRDPRLLTYLRSSYETIEFYSRSRRGASTSLSLSMRNEFIGNFKELGLDDDVIDFLKEVGLWNSPNFWRSFFNSSYFTPLYKKYNRGDSITEFVDNYSDNGRTLTYGGVSIENHSWWGENILDYAKIYLGNSEEVSS